MRSRRGRQSGSHAGPGADVILGLSLHDWASSFSVRASTSRPARGQSAAQMARPGQVAQRVGLSTRVRYDWKASLCQMVGQSFWIRLPATR